MTCREIEERLSALLDDALPAEERRKVEEHLASCPSCARALADLRKTVGLVRELGEVEPPPWLRQKIMTRVREEAAPRKKGILRALFFPLYIKVPVQAFAMVLIAVLAFQIYRTSEPERQALDLPLPPARVEQKAAAPGAAPGIPEPAPAPDLRKEERTMRGAAPSTAEPASVRPQTEPPRSRPQATEGKGLGFAPPPDRAKSAVPPEAERRLEPETGGAPAPVGRSAVRAPAAESSRDTGFAPMREAGKARSGAAYESKRKDQSESAVMAAKEDRTDAATMRKQALAPKPSWDLSLRVQDVLSAASAVERELRALSAGNIRRRARQGAVTITADLPAAALPGLSERLRALGELQTAGSSGDTRTGTVTVRVRIVEEEY
ncbi:MAG TPA: DUF2275 domain-containing protein [Syntrophales bacterium]|nr:DUF2275 domain-containing protein [Syntrophales bacterium]